MFNLFKRKTVSATCLLLGSSLAGGLSSMAATAATTSYPERAVTLTVPVAPGGTTDIGARLLAERLGQALGQSFVVENRPGASGAIGSYAVSRAKPDGYTLLFQYNAYHVITPQLTLKSNWDPLRDFVPVAHISSNPQVVVVRGDSPIRTFQELVAYGKANPGKLNYASAGKGSMHHVSAELLKQLANAHFTHIPYSGAGPALNNLLGGVVDFTLNGPSSAIQHIQSGKLRALAVTSAERLATLPDVPTTVELGYPDLIAKSWSAIYAPAGTPESAIAKIAAAIKDITAVDDYRLKLQSLGSEALFMGPAELGAYTEAEYKRWGGVLKAANIQAE